MAWLIAAVVLVGLDSTAQGTQRPASTTLVIYAVDPVAGTAVNLSSAELYIDPWGGGETYKVQPRGSEVRIPLDVRWPCSQDSGWCSGHVLDARITLRADGYEHVRSDHFPWLRGSGDAAVVRFGGGLERRIESGKVVTLTVPFRRPTARRLRVVDSAGNAITDARIMIRELLSQTNHCGWPEGTTAFEGKADSDGRVALPPGQVEFWVRVSKPHHVVVPTPRYDLNWITGRFDALESRIVLRPMRRRPLHLEFRNSDGTPAVVDVEATGMGCGAPGLLGRSGPDGRFSLAEFYPEDVVSVFVRGNGQWRWSLDPRTEQWKGRRVITLK